MKRFMIGSYGNSKLLDKLSHLFLKQQNIEEQEILLVDEKSEIELKVDSSKDEASDVSIEENIEEP